MTRRGWFASIAAALAARFVPARIRPARRSNILLTNKMFADMMLKQFQANLATAREIEKKFDFPGPKIGDTINVRKPHRFV